jgi:hypothetical protein
MNIRLKKLIGTVITVVFLTIYTFVALVIAERLMPGASGLAQLVFYLVAGLLWVVPVGALIAWMQRP